MQSPMVVDVFKDQLATIMEWHRRDIPAFRWGAVIHRRNERGRVRFGAITAGGESLVLTAELLDELSRMTCWLDGVVRVRLAGDRVLLGGQAVTVMHAELLY